MKKVSMIIPCYNVSRYVLDRMLGSVLKQIYKKLEVIMVNDGSTDETLSRLNEWKEIFIQHGYDTKVFTKSNGGSASAINVGLNHFSGEYICFPDADDELNPSYVLTMVEYLEGNPHCNVVRCDAYIINENDKENGSKLWSEDFSQHGFFNSILIKDVNNVVWPMLVRASFFKERIPKLYLHESSGTQEWQLLLPLTYKEFVPHIKIPLYNYYIYSDSYIRRTIRDKDEESLLNYAKSQRENILVTLNNMMIPFVEIGVYSMLGIFSSIRMIMRFDYISVPTKNSCSLLLAYLLKHYMNIKVDIAILMEINRFHFYALRLEKYFLDNKKITF